MQRPIPHTQTLHTLYDPSTTSMYNTFNTPTTSMQNTQASTLSLWLGTQDSLMYRMDVTEESTPDHSPVNHPVDHPQLKTNPQLAVRSAPIIIQARLAAMDTAQEGEDRTKADKQTQRYLGFARLVEATALAASNRTNVRDSVSSAINHIKYLCFAK